ncbi:mas-related G-protein coupled receptor member X1-like [Octodon degus]|uniref:Mas-related G-protein coupled receptor member X1-like n=1 Tax=Octodon degus TaxID=10160 RepID=A0A6P3FWQ5_OCTDE|nr:mas-related G-protein coupled receptor member X1-like [Octodon degus]
MFINTALHLTNPGCLCFLLVIFCKTFIKGTIPGISSEDIEQDRGEYTSEEFVSVTMQTTNGSVPTTVNGTYTSSFLHCDKTLILNLLIVIIALVGMGGNGVVISLLGCCMRRNAISVYILNLAASDFLLLCCQFINYLFSLCYKITYHIIFSIALIPYIAGLSILSAISVERCLCVFRPIWYRCHRPKHMSAAMCALLWTVSLLFSILEWYYSGFLYVSYSFVHWRTIDFIIAAWLISLLLILLVSSLSLMIRILCGSRRMPLTKLYVTILLTVLVFLICGLPFGIYWFLLSWLPVHFYYFCHFSSVLIVLSCINSCANPIIYFLIGSFKEQHNSIKLVLQRALQDSP